MLGSKFESWCHDYAKNCYDATALHEATARARINVTYDRIGGTLANLKDARVPSSLRISANV